ncbi:vWA domain-containing protein [Roseibacillus ishigakijimensis]|uniref:VWA domain-containing protein n=1 Tax=Roseibacillus ishigakijimensis TaxID=454146 RepID=A0A934RNL8_9BACT|nr:vWA domain-containing protein [Roseibacillus ishigakijimensis]MBK1832962.1 VWA domain-containing protein [Roseibacillus ishigakijimensis]
MSAESIVNPEIEKELQRQRARATVSSLLISLLTAILLGLILYFIAIKGITITQPDIVTYKASAAQENETEKPELNPSFQRKPSAPSSAMAKVIAANTVSPTAVPVPDTVSPVQSLDFGDGDDFGAGWGAGDGGAAGGGGGTTFFGQKSNAERIAFVIDYSKSMGGPRQRIMRAELTKSLDELPEGSKYQMIFFAGPVWVAGDKVRHYKQGDPYEQKGNFIETPDGKVHEWENSGGAGGFAPKRRLAKASWIDLSLKPNVIGNERRAEEERVKNAIKESKKVVEETPLIYGTRWKYALEMAMDMDPAPQVIYFMTDGTTGRESMEVAEDIGRTAKRKGTIVNCIAMMEPDAHEAMKELAERTGGKFTVVERDGSHREIPLD